MKKARYILFQWKNNRPSFAKINSDLSITEMHIEIDKFIDLGIKDYEIIYD